MESHRSQCPDEPVECPFVEAGCKIIVRHQQLGNHVATSLQQHLMLLMTEEGYKMCLAVYANGVGEGAGDHISVALFHLRGEYDNQLKWPTECDCLHMHALRVDDGFWNFIACRLSKYPPINERVQVGCRDKFCNLNNRNVSDCLTFQVRHNGCYLTIAMEY